MNRVQKFRSVEDMARAAVVVTPGDGFERFARQCARYFALAPRTYPRGVFRFRTLEEAQAARERVTTVSVRGAFLSSSISPQATLRGAR
jgi:coproporphyrinogen III oxidase